MTSASSHGTLLTSGSLTGNMLNEFDATENEVKLVFMHKDHLLAMAELEELSL